MIHLEKTLIASYQHKTKTIQVGVVFSDWDEKLPHKPVTYIDIVRDYPVKKGLFERPPNSLYLIKANTFKANFVI